MAKKRNNEIILNKELDIAQKENPALIKKKSTYKSAGNKGNPTPPCVFPTGNNFWQKRSKHGRSRIIQDPQFLLDAANEYFQACIDDPLKVMDFKGKDAELVHYEKPRVFQKIGVARYCGVNDWEVIKSLEKVSNEKLSSEFSQVIKYIESVIYEQKFENAAVGIFNPVLMARDLRIADVSESSVVVKDVTQLTDKELLDKYNNLKKIIDGE